MLGRSLAEKSQQRWPAVSRTTSRRGGWRRRPLASLYTKEELRAWRVRRGLTVPEMALLLGMSVPQLERRLYGVALIGLRMDRQIEAIDALVQLGVIPPGAPIRLAVRIIAGMGW
jgi:hypothetical protein